jgi:RNA polymerase sigma factor (sigma-70 family)
MNEPMLSYEEECALIKAAQAGDSKAAGRLVLAFMPLVVRHVTYIKSSYQIKEDLIQEGILGIYRALGKFELERNLRFATYVSYWIAEYVHKYMKKHTNYNSRASGFQDWFDFNSGFTTEEAGPSLEESIEHKELMALLSGELDMLHLLSSDKDKTVISERFRGSKSHQKIADESGVRCQAIQQREAKLFSKLRVKVLKEVDNQPRHKRNWKNIKNS